MSAIISECGKYRYRLDRGCSPPFEGSKVYAYFGVNPSTADASTDDATVRKWRGFTERNGGHRFIVGNVFCYRATDVKELRKVDDPFGPESVDYFQSILAEADILVPCWGSLSKLPKHLRGCPPQLLQWMLRSGKPVMCFGLTRCDQPKHPLMLGYDTPLQELAGSW
ncbi:hypothetical protein [Pseudomonas phage vB_PaeM_RP7]|uniref:DUF1643 domain-containing protein n=1 Tax=Pseudomonas phage PAP-JP TaxID=2583508 RepID=A0A5C1K6Q6_9CAUD|nr:hypothetical protein PAPJP_132 [Pseudomonas phage PAP-JP]UKH48009.1 MAG: hypothetical protein [Pseudomonas phage RP4]WAB57088.1 hypothetical protein [Pseudomonas phage vB_PaeM_RP7]WAB57225.1 hypothetical protein [Pseudomonas phage vB_PaeM_RP8]